MMGETVIAIGNPFGLSHTVTTGVLSARGRTVPADNGEARYTDFLQTDASINPGNSGGPLVNLAGQVIGINSAIIQGANGIGFAIPSDRAQRVVDDLLRFGELQPLWTGLRLETVDAELARRAGLPVNRGAVVLKVFPDSPAATRRRPGRRRPRRGARSASHGARGPDHGVLLGGAGHADSGPVAARRAPLHARADRGAAAARTRPAGVAHGARSDGHARARGLIVDRVEGGSLAERAGLEPGDRVLAANGQRLDDVEKLGHEVLRALDRGSLFLIVGRGRFAYNLNFPL